MATEDNVRQAKAMLGIVRLPQGNIGQRMAMGENTEDVRMVIENDGKKRQNKIRT